MTTPSLPVNHCSNPNLAAAATGWGVITGGAGQRVVEWDARTPAVEGELFAFRLDSTVSTPRVYLPSKAVQPGDKWGFGVSVIVEAFTAAGSCNARMQVDWYDAAATFLGHTDGAWQRVNYGQYRFIGHLFTAPANAARANVTVALADAITPNSWALRGAFYAEGEVHNPTLPDLDENICPNPDLDVDTVGWGIVANATNPQRVEAGYFDADHAFQVDATNPDPGTGVVAPEIHAPALDVFDGNIYAIRLTARMLGVLDDSAGARLRIDYYSGATRTGSAFGSSAAFFSVSDWANLTATVTIPEDVDSIRVVVEASGVPEGGTAHVQATAASYIRNPQPRPVPPPFQQQPPPVFYPGQVCPNPILETDAAGWSSTDGVTRVPITPSFGNANHACQSTAHEDGGEYVNQLNLPELTSVTYDAYRFAVAVRTSQPGRAFLRVEFRDSVGVPIATADSLNHWVNNDRWYIPEIRVNTPPAAASVHVSLHTHGMDTGNSIDAPTVRATLASYNLSSVS